MFDFLGAIGSVATGGIAGLIGTGISQFMEHRKRKAEYAFKLSSRRLDMEMMDKRAKLNIQEKGVDADIAVEVEAGKAFRESHKKDRASYISPTTDNPIVQILLGIVDFIRGLIRPAATVFFSYITWNITNELLVALGGIKELPQDQMIELLNLTIQTILFITTTCILWWFGTRPPKTIATVGR
tara:strand:+ start:332 stop:883 length:552 start_codon:yes stop_codon:yes gene_type:complete